MIVFNYKLEQYFGILFLSIVILLLASCEKKASRLGPDSRILAKVGDRIITEDEFRKSYEFGLHTLRSGDNPRKTYLNYMIKELLLANEGFRLGLNKTTYVTSRLERRKYNDLLEGFIGKYVHAKVKIPEEDIQEAVKKSTVKWSMIIWPTQSLEEAEKVIAATRDITLESFIENQLNKDEIVLKNKTSYYTGWIDFLDLHPDVLEKVVNVEMGQTSGPFPYGRGYAVAQVLDINREAIKAEDLQTGARRKKIQSRLHNIEADRIVRSLMDSLLTPLDVRVKGSTIELLAPPLYDWIKDGLPDSVSLFSVLAHPPDSAKHYLKKIVDLQNETLVNYQKGKKQVKDYIEYMDYYRSFINKSQSYEDFKNRLVTEIGRMLKNEVFVDIAVKDGFEDSTAIKQDLKLWEQKWTYDIYRNKTVLEINMSEKEMKDYFKNRWRELSIADVDTTRFYKYKNAVHNALLHEKQLLALEKDILKLKQKYNIWIDEDLLGQIELVDGDKRPQTAYFLRKSFTTEAALPTVDVKWTGF